jgi:SAM-dependent methyltransferase
MVGGAKARFRTERPTQKEDPLPPRNAEHSESARVKSPLTFKVHLPTAQQAGVDQDAEWCIVETSDERRRVRFHDYNEIYNVPGLYEHLFYDKLECNSPRVVRNLVGEVLTDRNLEADQLSVLDVGAGNGMVGEELVDLGVGSVVGVDIIPEAAAAAERDRPGIYNDYRVVDLTDVPPEDNQFFESAGFTGMTTVAALGFADIPPNAFAQAYNYVRPEGLVAFTIKESFVGDQDQSGFSRLIKQMLENGLIEELAEERYRHRLAVSGEPLYYLAYVAEKHSDIPEDWIASLQPVTA